MVIGSVAQLVEQEPFKLKVVGSIPTRPTIIYNPLTFEPKSDIGVLSIIFRSK